MKQALHYAQTIQTGRFQTWAPDFNNLFDIGESKITEEIPLGNIKDIPVAMVVSKYD